MVRPSEIQGDVRVRGSVVVEDGLESGVAYVGTTDLKSDLEVPTSLQSHRMKQIVGQSGTAVTARLPFAICQKTTTLVGLEVCVTVTAAIGAATVTVDLLKNGTTVLSAPVTIDSSDAVRAINLGTITTSSAVDNDVLEANIVATAGGGTLPVGLACQLIYDEAP